MKKNGANHLDEMQDQKLLKLEEKGFWGMFWALLVLIAVQLIAGGTIRQVAGEGIVLLAGSVLICVKTLQEGIWTRRPAPSRKDNAAASIVPAVLIGAVNAVKMIRNKGFSGRDLLVTAAFMAAGYVLCFGILELFRAVWKKRRSALDDVQEEGKE